MSCDKYVILRCVVIVIFSASIEHVVGQSLSKFITIDQFGYLPTSKKIAVIRDPQTGYDAADSFSPGNTYTVVNKSTGISVLSSSPMSWNNGSEDPSSGDKVWWFDFSSLTTPGAYYIVDVERNVRSYDFEIGEDVYAQILKHAVRTFYYQRAGFEKKAQFAEAGWADGASHLGSLQDKNARVYNDKTNASTEVDVQGGWYDAGDYNKYTNWTANYVVDFMRAYLETPGAWGDNYNLPESGNGMPDLLDEAKWGVDFLLRMQKENGSVLSIVGLSHASPPSSASGQSLYGTPSTSATLNTAAAFAIASKVYGSRGMKEFSNQLKERAIKAWTWATANPSVLFSNNDSGSGTGGLGAGQQETDDYGRAMAKLEAACFLLDITGEAKYKEFFDANYDDVHLKAWSYAYPFETANQEILLYYTTLAGATEAVVNDILSTYKNAMNGVDNFTAFYNDKDPYLAYIKDYTWGSNSTKASQGLMYSDMITYNVDPSKEEDAKFAAEGYIHYLHGVNPFNMVYLSNMYGYGGDNTVNEFYHTWFGNGSPKWDRVGVSTYGPAPGFLTGGPNPTYARDGCCPAGCGDSNAICNSESLTPPEGQPNQKSYKDFNTSWPLNSWSVTENSNGYQLNYIRLLSKFVDAKYDCSGTFNGSASLDACNICSGGNTGIIPIADNTKCNIVTGVSFKEKFKIEISPNPTAGILHVATNIPGEFQVTIIDHLGKKMLSETSSKNSTLTIDYFRAGIYIIIVKQREYRVVKKILKLNAP